MPTANPRAFLVAIAAWVGGTLLAARLVEGHSISVRAAGVAVAMASAIPWARLAIGGIREADEFSQRVHVLAIAIAFGGVALSTMLLGWLQQAEFVGPVRIGGVGFLVVWLWWGAGLLIAARHYR